MEEKISKGFFQRMLENNVSGEKPILQIVEARSYPKSQKSIAVRVRMSDSVFTYANCVGSQEVFDLMKSRDLMHSNALLRVNTYTISKTGDKLLFCMINVDILEEGCALIGNPVTHSGNPDNYRGMENMPARPNPAQSPSRKRQAAADSFTPSKKAVPQGGVFSKRVLDIKDVNPYVHNFLLCGIAAAKENLREINTKRGMSKVFSFTLTDDHGDSVRITAWGEQAEKFFGVVDEGSTYYVNVQGSATVRETNKRFNYTGHPYEIQLNQQCAVEPCTDRVVGVAPVRFNLVPLRDLKLHTSECVDVVGVLEKVDEVSTVNTKDGRTLHKRGVYLVDETKALVQLTLWEDDAHSFDYPVGTIVGLKGASVREFNGGISLSIGKFANQVYINPGGDAYECLEKWYKEERPLVQDFDALSTMDSAGSQGRDLKMVGVVIGSGMAHQADDRGMFLNIKVSINAIKTENAFYQSCMTCRKKVTVMDNQISCDRCGPQTEAKYVYMLSAEVADFTGTTWVTFFDESAKNLLGVTADVAHRYYTEDKDSYDAMFDKIRFQEFVLRCRVKYEIFNDKQNLRWTVMQMKKVDYGQFAGLYQKTLEKMANL